MQYIRAGQVDQVIVALPWSAEGRLQEVVGELALTPVRIRLAPDLANFAFSQRPVMMLGEVPVLSLFDRPISGFNHAVKWLEDKILTLARSEEHTSELQSLMRISYAVFCLKKKKHQRNKIDNIT